MIDKAVSRKKRRENKEKNKQKWIIISLIAFIIISCIIIRIYDKPLTSIDTKAEDNSSIEQINLDKMDNTKEEVIEEHKVDKKEIVITVAGDCTLGTDTKFSEYGSFQAELAAYNNDYSHMMKNVVDIFKADDYTLVNLETTFTDATQKANKAGSVVFHFKGPKEYVNILTSSSIEGVTIANNHTYDYGEKGLNDTTQTLEANNVDYCGYKHKIIKEIKGIKVGILGYNGWMADEETKAQIKSDIQNLRKEGCIIVIPYFHWGLESQSIPYEVQTTLGRYAIDCGADIVYGSHPHVLQSMENYKDRLIVYSMGNFCFGGNSNPSDKRTIIVQNRFTVEDKKITNIENKVIPTLISSTTSRNDYVPTPAVGDTATSILNYLNELSPTLKGNIKNEYFSIFKK